MTLKAKTFFAHLESSFNHTAKIVKSLAWNAIRVKKICNEKSVYLCTNSQCLLSSKTAAKIEKLFGEENFSFIGQKISYYGCYLTIALTFRQEKTLSKCHKSQCKMILLVWSTCATINHKNANLFYPLKGSILVDRQGWRRKTLHQNFFQLQTLWQKRG